MKRALGRAISRASGGVSRDDVRWAYRTLLGREPESEAAVESHLTSRNVRGLVDSFLRAPEFANVAVARGMRVALPSAHYLSLGTHCFASAFLRRMGVRDWSGPFDWAFSSVPMVIHCLEDGFVRFGDRSEYEPVAPENRPNGPTVNRVHHRFYRDSFGVQFVFNHHDVHLDEGHAYLRRCVARFQAALADSVPVVFLLVTHNHEGLCEQIAHLAGVLKSRKTRMQLVGVAVDASGPANDLPVADRLAEGPEYVVHRFRPTSPLGAVSFTQAIDEACVADLLARRARMLIAAD